ncbi:hypothetical protein J2751_001386 [Halorubrum alkaliphilum]|uniref:Uncharacterized protein n=1 Tax=Halorubrum alkaliphilum TaxID=261290 RepID=A0A8T4GD62_9EURY|nr:hypothetical protein [Halorubrum alkaliphilum]MBP1922378.1 hypothetical protein [Halorubrum alkaliphilum]
MATDLGTVDGLPARFHGVRGAVYRGVLAGTLVALAYLVVLAAYLSVTSTDVIDVGRAGYPLVWFVTGAGALAAITAVDGRASSGRRRTSPWAVGVAVGYVLLLAAVSGLVTLDAAGFGGSVTGALPGWGPVVLADLGIVGLAIVPFQSVGYVVLGVLLARALTVRSGSLAAGVVGLFSCAGCLLPIVAAAASAVGVPLFEGVGSYRLSTVAFVSAALLLVGVIVRGAGSCRR